MSSSSAPGAGDPVPIDDGDRPSRPRPVRFISPAVLNLHRVYEQDQQRIQNKDGVKVPDPTVAQVKGKPRLLIMGQKG